MTCSRGNPILIISVIEVSSADPRRKDDASELVASSVVAAAGVSGIAGPGALGATGGVGLRAGAGVEGMTLAGTAAALVDAAGTGAGAGTAFG